MSEINTSKLRAVVEMAREELLEASQGLEKAGLEAEAASAHTCALMLQCVIGDIVRRQS